MNIELNSIIDHTLLKTDATEAQIKTLCKEAKEYKFASVCVSPIWISLAAKELEGSNVDICTVIGFPQGTMTTETKAFETEDAIANGATEVDMVISVGKVKDKDFNYVQNDIEAVVKAAKGKALVKVIIETCLLTDEEKNKVCKLAKVAGADFVKTSTGFSNGGATVDDIALMRKAVGEDMGVKASGGVGTREVALAMVEAGATRLGASRGIDIVKE